MKEVTLDTRSVNNEIPEPYRPKTEEPSKKRGRIESRPRLHRTKAERRQGKIVSIALATTIGAASLVGWIVKNSEPGGLERIPVVQELSAEQLKAQKQWIRYDETTDKPYILIRKEDPTTEKDEPSHLYDAADLIQRPNETREEAAARILEVNPQIEAGNSEIPNNIPELTALWMPPESIAAEVRDQARAA